MIKLSIAVAAAAILSAAGDASAQTYPSRPITMLVGYAVGGPSDTIARIMADRMKVALGQPVIVENVTGAAGSIAVGRGARAAWKLLEFRDEGVTAPKMIRRRA